MKILAQQDDEGNIGIGIEGIGGMIAMITGSDFSGWTDEPIDEPSGAGMTSEKIACRIVACWNLHDGIPIEDIERTLRLLEALD